MSNALALAAVTAVLKDLLDNALIDHSVSSDIGGRVTVSTLSPERMKIGAVEETQLNLFLYHVAPNAAWRNNQLPSRNAAGERISNPPLALDLYYLLTAYEKLDFEAEILLGYAMQVFHENPVLTRTAIRQALAPTSPVSGSILPPALTALGASDLADQFEQVKLVMHPLSLEEMSKLWGTFQTSYRPSVAYQVSVVLIESNRATKPALPVRAITSYVGTFRLPVVSELRSQSAPDQPVVARQPIYPTSTLVLLGRQLRGDVTVVNIGGKEVTPAAADLSDTEIRVALPSGLRAGVQSAQVVQTIMLGDPPTAQPGAESNATAFMLHPVITTTNNQIDLTLSNVETTTNGHRNAILTLKVNPKVGQTQRVSVQLNEFNPPTNRPAWAYSFSLPPRTKDSDPAETDTLAVALRDVAPASYLVRVQVDGAASGLVSDGTGKFNGPQVTLA